MYEITNINELIHINYDDENHPTVSGRELWKGLRVETPYTQWFERMCKYGFAENTDFVLVSQICETNNPKNPHTIITDHNLTIPMAKELCMLQRTEKGKEIRRYFISVEEQWNSPEAVMARAIRMADMKIKRLETECIQLQTTVSMQSQRIQEMRPKEIFADAVTTSKKSILVGDLAKILKQNGIKTGQRRLFAWMRENGYLMKHGTSYNLPTQYSMELGLFETKETPVIHADGHTIVNFTVKVTGKGQQYFINKFLKN